MAKNMIKKQIQNLGHNHLKQSLLDVMMEKVQVVQEKSIQKHLNQQLMLVKL